jgi:hypothetical protein
VDRIEEYRWYADRAEETAQRMSDPELKRQLRNVADQWRQLARLVQGIERFERWPLSPWR